MTNDDPRAEPVSAWCRLNEDEAEIRREWMEGALLDDLEALEETDGGVTLTFAGTGETLDSVAAFVRKESDCCPFATFEVVVEPPYERTRLTMTAPEDGPELAPAFFRHWDDAPPSAGSRSGS